MRRWIGRRRVAAVWWHIADCHLVRGVCTNQRAWLSSTSRLTAERVHTSPFAGGPTEAAAPGGGCAAEQNLGVVQLTAHNITAEMETRVPLLLYFMAANHPEGKEFTERVCHQVSQANRRLMHDGMGEAYLECGKDAGLAIKLGIVDCLQEAGLARKFSIDPHMFPMMYFVWNKAFVDKLVGVVPESQVKEAVEAFIEYAKEETRNAQAGCGTGEKLKRHDNDDENAMTLLSVAHAKLKAKEVVRAKELFTKALEVSLEEKQGVDARLGADKRRRTPAMWDRLKREGCYNTAPQALCGLAMCAMSSRDPGEGKRLADRVREEYPWALQDMREVAEVVARIDMLIVSGFDAEKDNYLSLLKYDDLVTDPVHFYRHHTKLAVAHFLERAHGQAIEECLRLIRAEPKLLPALKEGGIVPEDFALRPGSATPARRVLLCIFEALGSTSEHTITGRRMLQLYT